MNCIYPYEFALAHYPCAMDEARLLATPSDEIGLATNGDRGIACLSSVYVMANAANGLLKIGYADHLARRLSGLNCGSPVPVQLRHFLYFVDLNVAKRVEREAHVSLAAHRKRGEWFDVTYEQATGSIAQSVKCGHIKWWTEYERRDLMRAIEFSTAKHEEKQRFFGT